MNNPMQSGGSNLLLSPSSGPPIAKKQRGGATPGSIKARQGPPSSSRSSSRSSTTSTRPPPPQSRSTEVVDDAIARRRAELRRLQEMSSRAMGSAKKKPSSALSGPPTSSSMPSRQPLSKRSSDIFPNAPKSPSAIPRASTSSTKVAAASLLPPPSTTATTTTTLTKVNPNLPPATPQNGPPTPAVGRRLEFPSSQKANSAALASASASASAADSQQNEPPRAKSVPPRRPPGPPPPTSGGFQPMTKVKAKVKAKATAKPTAKARPAPIRPTSLLPTVKTKSPKNGESETTKPASEPTSTSAPPIASSDPPTATAPPIASSGPPTATAPPTSTAPPSATDALTETPKPQKSTTANGSSGGADTPPSSGSSARRQKLQLMREQAMVASNIDKSAKKAPPAKSSFYDESSAGPATAAFAKAIGKKENVPPEIPSLAKPPPASTMQSAAQARLEDAYQKSEKDKLQALVRIKELEDKLSQVAKQNIENSKKSLHQQKLDVQTLLSVAETQGPQAALDWAKTNASSMPTSPTKLASRTGFNTGMGATPRKIMPGIPSLEQTPHKRARMAIRALRARPSDPTAADRNETPEATERRLIRKFKEATKHVSHEFSSDLANYIVRRPYGIITEPVGLFEHCRPPNEKPDAYQRRAHVSNKTTIEVAAIVKADKTPLLVFGNAGIRYQTNPSSRNVPPNWKHFEDVDAEDRPLGHVTYIDGQANEKEYSLDEILEEALLVREQYCGTLTSTALALPDPQQLQQQPQQTQQPAKQPATETKPKEAPTPPQQQPPPTEIDSGSSDVLVDFLGLVFSFFFNLIWGIFIGTPLKIVRMTIVLVVALILVQALQLYVADGYNAWALREFSTSGASTCSSILASDLSWFSNHHPGIM